MLDPTGSTKTGESRSVPLASAIRPGLEQGIANRAGEEPLFTGRGGGRLNYGWFRRSVFAPAVARTGLKNVSIHSLRHTCASLLIQMGTPVTSVSQILGHASVKMTLDVYSHFYEKDSEVWLNRLATQFMDH